MGGNSHDAVTAMTGGWAFLRKVRPAVHRGLAPINGLAHTIPNPELKWLALDALEHKRFHCEGGAVFTTPPRDPTGALLRAILAYQTLCDYLDTLTDRGPSQDPRNLRQLHQALLDALTPGAPLQSYYLHHPEQDDGGYMAALVSMTQRALEDFPGYPQVAPAVRELALLYIDLQVFKHGPPQDRVPLLQSWYHRHRAASSAVAALTWWEFSAAAGSTLGIFALWAEASQESPSEPRQAGLLACYWPWIGALHILLDYYIDLEEDRLGGDFNFIRCYPGTQDAIDRLQWIFGRAMAVSQALPDAAFHRYVIRGLLGFYLSDRKLVKQPAEHSAARRLLATGGLIGRGLWAASRWGRSR